MAIDEKGLELHDRASRGEELSEQERQQLEDWYARQDRMEWEAIQPLTQGGFLAGLQSQIEAALAQLVKLTNRIQEVASENEELRKKLL